MRRARGRARAAHAERVPRHIGPLLRITDLLRPLYRLRGVDYPVFRHLLWAKLVLDGRRFGRDRGQVGMMRNVGFLGMLGLYCSLSLFVGLFLVDGEEPFTDATVMMSFAVFMIALPLLLDFSAVLLDTSDVSVLAPLPVDGATLLAVRTTHISLYLVLIAASASSGLLLGGLRWYSPPAHLLATSLCVALVTVFTFSCVVLVIVVALRRVNLSRFKNGMVWVQVATLGCVYFGSQLMPMVAVRAADEGWFERAPWLLALYPPAWFGGLYRTLVAGPAPVDALLAPLAIAAPIGLGVASALVARGGFVQRLAALAEARGSAEGRQRSRGLAGRIGRRWARVGAERAGYCFFLDACAGERQFKLRIAPVLFIPVFGVLIPLATGGERALERVLDRVPYLCLLPVMLVPLVFGAARFSEFFEARWCFDCLDKRELKSFARGVMKAVAARFMVLPLLLLGGLALALGGLDAVGPTLLCVGISLLLVRLVLPRLGAILPFSEEYSYARAQSGAALVFGLALLVGVVICVTYLLGLVPYAQLVCGLVVLALGVLAWARLDRMRFGLHQDHVLLR